MRYPIFVFLSVNTVWAFDSPDEHDLVLEGYGLPHYLIIDSEGQILSEAAEDDSLIISDSGTPPNVELLRAALVLALFSKGKYWSYDAPIEILVDSARDIFYGGGGGTPFAEIIGRLLQFLHLKRRLPR